MPRRIFVTSIIETSDAVRPVGDATLNGRELAVASYLTDHVIPCLSVMAYGHANGITVEETVDRANRFADGELHPGESPGLSTSMRKWPRNAPCKRAYPPVNRLDDGTLFNW